ncbi:endonuclease/exonuclease/phosphatase (EEP) superfamily protein YafD [Microbacterium testaceum]|uniref:endonuclease/exonuclease/phosphatase family protein n=1 Tax=Microbacterium TaxID=33882 RepID=UPI00278470E6|nr:MULTISPECIES: endonuclease/exonuclease/phosphatase family protein [Microbacterium]MDQ1111805.1 endonuclease/exonuclease/phosphatase (EEP) superfamily protein YafD [Microbacterium testaceum]MDR6097657.1 endonuclease/exonuclease/phosphatase (EEP) superfamily protein YafD [Microbacterium sp. SORGH_AS_0454]
MPKHRRFPFLLALAGGSVAAFVVVWPQGVGIHRLPLVANAISLRALLALGFGVAALLVAGVAVWRRRWGVAAALSIALAVASVGNGAVLLARGGGAPVQPGELTIAAWNTYGGSVTPETIARMVRETGADVVSLPETDAVAAAEVAGILDLEGISMAHDTVAAAPDGEVIPTSILISRALGEYELDADAGSTVGLPSGVWRSVDGSGPILVAAHPMPPLPGVTDRWELGLGWIADRCTDSDVIVAGDLNSTVDHFAGLGVDGGTIGGCRDAAAEAGSAAAGTWPVRLPVGLAAPIDHVLVGSAWRVNGFAVLDGFDDASSDHRPIVATLTRQ